MVPESEYDDWTQDDAESEEPGQARDERTGQSAAAARMRHQAQWVDLQIKQAMERGDFDNLPGYGKPIKDLGSQHDPDWWLKKLIEREHITGVLPAALQLRKEDLELEATLDQLVSEAEVRRELESFNERIRQARYQLTGGPPVVTQMRDVEVEVVSWRERRSARLAPRPAVKAAPRPAGEEPTKRRGGVRRRWWRRST